MDFVEFVTEIEEVWLVIMGFAGGLGLSVSKLRKAGLRFFGKTKQVAKNLDELAENAIGDIVREQVESALHEFKVEQAKRDTAAWNKHDTCHEELKVDLNGLATTQSVILSNMAGLGTKITHIEGWIEGQGT